MQRSTRKLTLTDAGATFYARCADQVEALTEGRAGTRCGQPLAQWEGSGGSGSGFFSVCSEWS